MHPLREYRKAKGLTLAQFAVLVGRSFVTVSRWENGLRQPRVDDLQKISEVTGIPLDEMVRASRTAPEAAE